MWVPASGNTASASGVAAFFPPRALGGGGGCLVAIHAPAVWAKIWHASQGVRRKKREWHDGYGLVQSVYA